jgi:nitrilase
MKAAAIQMCSTPDVQHNLDMTYLLLKEAKAQQANLAVLPEMFWCLGAPREFVLNQQELLGAGPLQDFLASTAKELNLWIVGGTIPIQSLNPQRAYASCLTYSPTGTCVRQYHKIHLFDALVNSSHNTLTEHRESDFFMPGEHVVTVATDLGKIGLAICYDLRFPELFQQLNQQGAEVFCLPSAFTVPTGEAHWHVLTRARAIENFSYMIAANQVGQHNAQRSSYGHSLIISPFGEILVEAVDNRPGVIVADINLDEVHMHRLRIPVHKHRRL